MCEFSGKHECLSLHRWYLCRTSSLVYGSRLKRLRHLSSHFNTRSIADSTCLVLQVHSKLAGQVLRGPRGSLPELGQRDEQAAQREEEPLESVRSHLCGACCCSRWRRLPHARRAVALTRVSFTRLPTEFHAFVLLPVWDMFWHTLWFIFSLCSVSYSLFSLCVFFSPNLPEIIRGICWKAAR